MSLGPSDVVAGRYELVRDLGGGHVGRVFLAGDRHLARQVVLRVVEPGDPEGAARLRDEGRMMAAVQFDCLQAIPVLVDGDLPGGGAYLASELVEGIPLDEVIATRAPLPVARARALAVEMLEAGLAVRRSERGRGDVVVASALVTTDGHLRVTRFARAPGPGPSGEDPAVPVVARALEEMLAGDDVPPALADVIADAGQGRILSGEVMRSRLQGVPVGAAGELQETPPFARWPWIVVGVIVFLLIAVLVLVWAL